MIGKLVNQFIESIRISYVCSFFFCTTYGIVNGILFIRMYVLYALLTVMLSYLLVTHKPNEDKGISFYIMIGAISLCGILTQYFYIIYLAIAAIVYGLMLLHYKRIKELVAGCVTIGGTVLLALFIFPAMYTHIFRGGRGTEAIDNMKKSLQ